MHEATLADVLYVPAWQLWQMRSTVAPPSVLTKLPGAHVRLEGHMVPLNPDRCCHCPVRHGLQRVSAEVVPCTSTAVPGPQPLWGLQLVSAWLVEGW